jgi:hypothetical protein
LWVVRSTASITVRRFVPLWSEKGDQLYYLSDRDGRFCVWAQRLDSETKALKGPPYALQHLHQQAASAAMLGGTMFVAGSRDRLFIPEWTLSSNIWTARLTSSR